MKRAFFNSSAAGLLFGVPLLLAQTPGVIVVKSSFSTSPVNYDANDVAIWRDATDPAKSLVVATDKGTYPDGGLFVWNLDGTQRQRLNISRPNHVDIRYGLQLGGQSVDIAAVSMRDHRQVRIYKIDTSSRLLVEVTTPDSTNVLNRMFKSPYGLALYKRASDGTIFVFVSSRHNESKDTLWQIQLEDDGTGRVKGTLVREFGVHQNVVEGMVADDELGYFYAAEERVGIHKFYADPEKGNARLVLFGTEDSLAGNQEGLALYKCGNGTGYLLSSQPGLYRINVYRREGDNGDPHRHRLVTTIRDANSETGEGLEATSLSYAPMFLHGFLIWHDQDAKTFRFYAWDSVAQQSLKICPAGGLPLPVAGDSFGARTSGKSLTLQQNYPNPFNPETDVRFVLAKAGWVQLTIYNVLGERIRRLLDATLQPGAHVVHWDTKDDAGMSIQSGIYFYQIQTDRCKETRRMALTR